MEIQFKELSEGSHHFDFQESQESLSLRPQELFLMRPVEVSLWVVKSKEKLTFQGRISALAQSECARCLSLVTVPLEAELKFILDQSEVVPGGKFEDDDYQFISKSVGSYSLNQRLREALLLSMPMRFLCSADCKGLCPRCGINLNLEKCSCKKEAVDPRWGKLQNLLKE